MSFARKATNSSLEDACATLTGLALSQVVVVYIMSLFWGGIVFLTFSYAVLLLLTSAIWLIHRFLEVRKPRASQIHSPVLNAADKR